VVYGVIAVLWAIVVQPRTGADALANVKHEGKINIVLAIFAVAISAPVVEEIFFRGLLYRSLRNGLSVVPAVLIAGVLFGFVHITSYPLDTLPVKAAFGVITCLLYERTGSLLPGIGLHAFVDASAVDVALTGNDRIVIVCSLLVVVSVIVGASARRAAGWPRRAIAID
jgi:membrane protease YdiL (CAAX protease family)